MFHSRGNRGFRKRAGSSLGRVIQSYKNVIFLVNASFGAGFTTDQIVHGVDSVAAGQTSATFTDIPTGSIIKQFEVQFCAYNLTTAPLFINCSIQYKLSGQSFIDPNTVGGSPQRNQVLHMEMFTVGINQNSTHKFKFKIPQKFQRVREGMRWGMTWANSGSVNRQTQIIYKYYR